MKRFISLLLALLFSVSGFSALSENAGDDAYLAGLKYMEEEKYFSAFEAFSLSTDPRAADLAGECAQPWPESGEIWRSPDIKEGKAKLSFDVTQDKDSAAYLCVYKKGVLVSCIFVGGNGMIMLPLPGSTYTFRLACGTTWYGMKEAFGREGLYKNVTFGAAGEPEAKMKASAVLYIMADFTEEDAGFAESERITWEEFVQ